MAYAEAAHVLSGDFEDSGLNRGSWTLGETGTFDFGQYIKLSFNMLGFSQSEYSEQVKKLEEFCKLHELYLYGTSPTTIELRNRILPVYEMFFLTNNVSPGYGTKFEFDQFIECGHCRAENNQHNIVCEECDAILICNFCYSNQQSHLRNHFAAGNLVLYSGNDHCSGCSIICEDCGNPWTRVGSDSIICFECSPRYNCRACGEVEEIADEEENNGYCRYCFSNICEECEAYCDDDSLSIVAHEGRRICTSCFNSLDENIEVFDDASDMAATRLAIPTIQGRERIRFCGLEIEGINVARNAHDILASQLYDADLSDFDSRRGYHERYGSGFAHIERDSSCDWEAVIGPINMANTVEVRKLNQVIRIIRDGIKDNTVKLSLSCGLHIHVSAEKVGIDQAHRLHLLYTYLEDVMYRLGAAKWPMHRAIVNGDHHYQLSPRAEEKLHFVNRYNDNRYHGLSFSNYFQRMLGNCSCGAGRFGMFEECTCSLQKCTFEFRLFNTTANTKKIHAYMALTQALVAKAFSMSGFDTEAMQEMAFNMRNYKDMNTSQQEEIENKWMERMKFILEELPLTNDERQSILYCVESSEVAPIMSYCQSLVNNQMEVV